MIGELDDYAINFFREAKKIKCKDGFFVINQCDVEKISKFILSVLWRSSLSEMDTLRSVSLGKYQQTAEKIIIDHEPLSTMPQFDLLFTKMVSSDFETCNIVSYPVRGRPDDSGINIYGFLLSGFRVTVKIDNRNFPHTWKQLSVVHNNKFHGLCMKFEESTEFRMIKRDI